MSMYAVMRRCGKLRLLTAVRATITTRFHLRQSKEAPHEQRTRRALCPPGLLAHVTTPFTAATKVVAIRMPHRERARQFRESSDDSYLGMDLIAPYKGWRSGKIKGSTGVHTHYRRTQEWCAAAIG